MQTTNPFIEKSSSTILPGGPRYSYVLNNPLKYTDPSGYKKMSAYDMDELRESEAAYADMMGVVNDAYDMTYRASGGGGVGGYSYHNGFYYYNGIPTSYWEVHAEVIIPNSKNLYTAPAVSSSASSRGSGVGIGASGTGTGATGEYAGSLIHSGPYKGLYMVQFYGFDQHFFFYNNATGEFYAAYSADVLNPIDVLTGKIDWYSTPALPLPDFSSSISPWNTTINDPPIPHGNSIEKYVIPLPPIFRAIKGLRAVRGIMNFHGKYSTKAPKGFEWRGRPGSKHGSKNGNWFNPRTGESLHPDLNHPGPIGPHWDYKDLSGKWWRLFPDGTKVPK